MFRPLHAAAVAVLILALLAAGPLLLGDVVGTGIAHPELRRDWDDQGRVTFFGSEARLLLSRAPALDPDREALLVLSPALAYSEDEVRRVRAFVYDGGTLLVTGSRGAGKQLLDELDAGVTLSGLSLYTPVFDRTPDRMLAQSTGHVPALTEEVILTRPVHVAGGTAILRAPEPTWADVNDNGRPDLDEDIVTAVVAAESRFGEGRVIALGDDRFFQHGDVDAQRALVAHASGGGARRIVLDEAHRVQSDPFGLAPLLGASLGLVPATGMLMGVAGLGALLVLRPRLRRKAPPRAMPRARARDARLAEEALSELDAR